MLKVMLAFRATDRTEQTPITCAGKEELKRRSCPRREYKHSEIGINVKSAYCEIRKVFN
jgi:hypothetical protein